MWTTDPYGQSPSRARHMIVLALAAALLLALVVLVVGVVRLLASHNDDPGNPGGSAETDSASTTSDDLTGSTGAVGYETDPDTGLPIGSSSQDGLPIGFPRTDLGAAAVVVELNRAQIGLDVDAAVATIRVYADPEDQAFFDELATASIAQRRNTLDAPAAGEVNAPTAYAQTPIAYQVEQYPTDPAEDDTDLYLVSVLDQVTTTNTSGESDRSWYVGQQFVTWTPKDSSEGNVEWAGEGADGGAGDWKLVEPTEAARDQLLATAPPAAAVPATPEFTQAGWTALLDQPTDETSQ